MHNSTVSPEKTFCATCATGYTEDDSGDCKGVYIGGHIHCTLRAPEHDVIAPDSDMK